VKGDGYKWVKIAEPNKWRQKHRLLWESENGHIPAGGAVIFADGDRMNITLDNLLQITKGQLAIMNKRKLISPDREATKAGAAVAAAILKIEERIKGAGMKRRWKRDGGINDGKQNIQPGDDRGGGQAGS
jgi:hypothetical protein